MTGTCPNCAATIKAERRAALTDLGANWPTTSRWWSTDGIRTIIRQFADRERP